MHDLTPDKEEIEASRRFHLQYWLGLAEFSIVQDHRQSAYQWLTPNIRELLTSISDPTTADAETVATLRHDLAFLEGNVRAYREVIAALRGLKEPNQTETPDQDCGSRPA